MKNKQCRVPATNRLLPLLLIAFCPIFEALSAPPESAKVPHVSVKTKAKPGDYSLDGFGIIASDYVGAMFRAKGQCDWDVTLTVDPSAGKTKIEARLVQLVKGEARRIYKNPPPGKTGTKYSLTQFYVDGESGSSGSTATEIFLVGLV